MGTTRIQSLYRSLSWISQTRRWVCQHPVVASLRSTYCDCAATGRPRIRKSFGSKDRSSKSTLVWSSSKRALIRRHAGSTCRSSSTSRRSESDSDWVLPGVPRLGGPGHPRLDRGQQISMRSGKIRSFSRVVTCEDQSGRHVSEAGRTDTRA